MNNELIGHQLTPWKISLSELVSISQQAACYRDESLTWKSRLVLSIIVAKQHKAASAENTACYGISVELLLSCSTKMF